MRIRLAISILFFLVLITMPLGHLVLAQKDKVKKPPTSGVKLSESKLREAEFYFTEGEKYFILEDYSKALMLFNRSLEVDPSNATVYYKIAQILSRSQKQEDLVRSADYIANALVLEKANKYFYLLAASINTSLLRFDKAAQYYEEMMRNIAGTEDYLFELAAVYLYSDRVEEAFKVYQRAEDIFGINEISSVQKQKILLQQKKTAEALKETERLIDAFPDNERYVMAYAEMLSDNQQSAKAISVLEEFIVHNADAGNVKFLLAGIYRDIGQEANSRKLIKEIINEPNVDISSKIIVLGTYNAILENNRARNISDPETEIFVAELLGKITSAYPDEASVYIIGGDMYLNTGNAEQARKQYIKALELDDSNYAVWQNLLTIEMQSGKSDSLLMHSEKALELFPNQGVFYYFNGFALYRKKRYEEAAASFEQGKRLAREDRRLILEFNSMLGDTYNALKQYTKSDMAYEAVLEADPNNSYALNNYSYYLALRKEQLEKAEKMSAKLIKDHPNNPSFLDTHAWVLFMRQKYREARRVIERAIETGEANATHFDHYGDILFKLGDVDGAVKQWQKAKGLNPHHELIDKKIADRKLYE